eukprot:6207195-Pleurochrysis_carterae.AAC.6
MIPNCQRVEGTSALHGRKDRSASALLAVYLPVSKIAYSLKMSISASHLPRAASLVSCVKANGTSIQNRFPSLMSLLVNTMFAVPRFLGSTLPRFPGGSRMRPEAGPGGAADFNLARRTLTRTPRRAGADHVSCAARSLAAGVPNAFRLVRHCKVAREPNLHQKRTPYPQSRSLSHGGMSTNMLHDNIAAVEKEAIEEVAKELRNEINPTNTGEAHSLFWETRDAPPQVPTEQRSTTPLAPGDLDGYLSTFSLAQGHVSGDGACQYRAFCRALFQSDGFTSVKYETLRSLAVRSLKLRSNEAVFKDLVEETECALTPMAACSRAGCILSHIAWGQLLCTSFLSHGSLLCLPLAVAFSCVLHALRPTAQELTYQCRSACIYSAAMLRPAQKLELPHPPVCNPYAG